MARRRFFVDRVWNGRAEITGESAHHLMRVLRVEAGQKYEITDNERVWLAEVQKAHKGAVEFALINELEQEADAAPTILCLALIKFERFEWAVEKATELGVTSIVPVNAQRSERGLEDGARKRADRWRRIAHEASEQARRLRAPRIEDSIRFAEALRIEAGCRIWLDERKGAAPLLSVLERCADADAANLQIALCVGPEGGWTDAEREQFIEAGWLDASLGSSVLRAETAVCAALAIVNQMRICGKVRADTIERE